VGNSNSTHQSSQGTYTASFFESAVESYPPKEQVWKFSWKATWRLRLLLLQQIHRCPNQMPFLLNPALETYYLTEGFYSMLGMSKEALITPLSAQGLMEEYE
jgi:hypothetical protein